MEINNEIKVIALLSGYMREVSEGASFEETTYKTAEQIVKICTILVVSEILPTDEEIKKLMTTEHFNHDKGRYRKIKLDRIQGGKMIRDFIKKRLSKNFFI